VVKEVTLLASSQTFFANAGFNSDKVMAQPERMFSKIR
jgi:N-acetylglutamate synthase-like GNAT family acetyltransferase